MSKVGKPAGSLLYRIIKRVFDLVCAIVLLLPISIIILLSAIFIKIEDRGPVFYLSDRVGMNGHIFKMYKLRSMKVNAPDIRLADGSTYNSDNDPRVTKFGKIARKTSIDELPQVFNIIKGEMSFIGPRPDTPFGLSEYTSEDMEILRVKPGITGYNQVVNRNAISTKGKLECDKYYVQHLSLAFDIWIFLKTISAVFSRKNVNRQGQGKTFILEKDGSKSIAEVTKKE